MRSREQSRFAIFIERDPHLGNHPYRAVFEDRLVFVGLAIVGREIIPCDLFGEVERLVEALARMIRKTLALRERLNFEPVVEQKREIPAIDEFARGDGRESG